MADSPEIKWPPLDEDYIDEFGHIDPDIYSTAADLWPQAAVFARATLYDEAAGQIALLKVCAKITAGRSAGRIQIDSLGPYLLRSYKREILTQLSARRLHETLTADDFKLVSTGYFDAEVDKKILFEQIYARMDSSNQKVFGLLALGHSFEEIASALGRRSNVIRSAFSKQLKRIRKQLHQKETVG
jgi:DNA-directed RNA polymerase specialized sigma24 family protein